VREDQWHTARTSEVLVHRGRSRVMLATCTVKGTAAHRADMVAPRRRRRSLRPNLRAHGEYEVKGNLEHEVIGTKAREGSPPNHALLRREKMTGDGEFLKFIDCGALMTLDVARRLGIYPASQLGRVIGPGCFELDGTDKDGGRA
jgi:hypothetical protein